MSGYVIEILQENTDANMPARQLRVAAYCRVSTTHEEQKHSLDAQIRYHTQYIQQNPRWKFVGNLLLFTQIRRLGCIRRSVRGISRCCVIAEEEKSI